MVVGENPHAMAERKDGTYYAGDNKNSWVGVTLLQDLFIREHNWVADKIRDENPTFTEDEIFVSQPDYFTLLIGHQNSECIMTLSCPLNFSTKNATT